MIYVSVPEDLNRKLTFYLAMEEYVARNFDAADYFFMWQVQPTVIFGRNQLIETEVNLDYCRIHNIMTFRRKSGGGCVYADLNNLMFSYITEDENVNFTFNRYINMIVLTLHKLGVKATANGRNDILIGDKKVSGNAFYHIPGRSIVHGTMLYDTNMENMVGSITPNNDKLISKGIHSVRQHITLLKDCIDISIEEFKNFVRQTLCNHEIKLSETDIKLIKEIEKEYLSSEFIFGNNPPYNITLKRRINNVGYLEIRLEVKNNIIKSININGDIFIIGDIDNEILKPLKNVKLNYKDVSNALPKRLDKIIMNLDKNDFVELITSRDNSYNK